MTDRTARPAPRLAGEARVNGDKSCSHRALILGAMADAETDIHGLSDGDDVMATVAALRSLGRPVERIEGDRWRVSGGPWHSPTAPIDCANSGTTARLLIGATAGMRGLRVTFTGDPSLSSRPMQRLVAPLRHMGAQIEGGDTLPLTVIGSALAGIDHRNVPASAQVKSALFLAGLAANVPVRIVEPMPSRDHTEIMLRAFGRELGREDDAILLRAGGRLRGTSIDVAGDPSSAAFPLVAAAIVRGSDVRIADVMVNPFRIGLIDAAREMGADIRLENHRTVSGEPVADIHIRHAPLRPCRIAPDRIPAMIDEIPALAVLCAFADGESIIEGLGELRVKESDRLAGLAAGLTACGVESRTKGDALHIVGKGKVPGSGRIATHGDHRLAMAFLTLGLGAEWPVTVDRSGMIAASFPGFVETMTSLGAVIE